MYKRVSFNIYEENLQDIVYGEEIDQEKNSEEKNSLDKPIPKPPPQYWTAPLSYRRFSRKSEKKGIL